MKLHLGCGYDIKKGFINVDLNPINNQVRKVNLEKKLPFKDNQFSYVYSKNVFEHIVNIQQLMEEIWRICKHNAIIEFEVPHHASPSAICPMHKSFFISGIFVAFCKRYEIPTKAMFKKLKDDIIWAKGLNPLNYIARIFNHPKLKNLYESTFLKYIFIPDKIIFEFRVVKNMKHQ